MTADHAKEELGISANQLASAAAPELPTRALLDDAHASLDFIARPFSVWRDRPEIARAINDQLSRDAAA